jgi:hypothetical protein
MRSSIAWLAFALLAATASWGSAAQPLTDGSSVSVSQAPASATSACVNLGHAGSPVEMDKVPAEIRPFVPARQQVEWLVCADLDGDGHMDYLLVTKTRALLPGLPTRTLQVLIRQESHDLAAVVSNDNAVQPPYSDGINGMPQVTAGREHFEIVNDSAGSGGGDTWLFRFVYLKKNKTWFLTRVVKALQGDAHPTDDFPYEKNARQLGRVAIGDFDFRKFP